MATSGSSSVTVTSWDTLKFSWSCGNPDIANNQTVVNWKMELIATSSGLISSSAPKAWSVTVNGEKYSGTNYIGIGNNSTKLLASGSTTIPHNADGTKTFSYSFSQAFNINFNGNIGTKSGSGSGTLPNIPRQSTFATISGDTIGGSMTVNIARNNASYTHQLWYKVGNSAWIDLGTGIAITKTFTIDMNLCNQYPNATSGILQLCVRTFNGTAIIGSDVYKNVTVYVPENAKPILSLSVSDSEAYRILYGDYVKGKSKFKVELNVLNSYGATTSAYSTSANGSTYTASSFTTDVIVSSGSLTISAKVTDSRGRTATASQTVNVLDYSMPKISALNAKRCDVQGNSSSSGAYLSVLFNVEISALGNKNTAGYTVKYKKSAESESEYTTETLTDYAGRYSVTGGVFIFPADKSSSYDITLTATDDFSSIPKSTNGSSIKKTWSLFKRGLGIAFGKVAEKEGLEIAFDMYLTGKMVQEDRTAAILQNNWTNYSGYEVASFWKDKCNVVHLSGLIKGGTTTAETVIFTLPEGYRPRENEKFFAVSVNAICVIDVYSSGNVAIKTGANTMWLSLSGISFRAAN